MTFQSKLQGFETPDDRRVPIPLRDWNAFRLALWRSKVGWEIAERAAVDIIDGCAHVEGCAGKETETEPCLPDCPDREQRLSALVILSAARMFAPVDARKPADAAYYTPSREYFSEVLSSLAAAQAELEVLRAALGGVQPPPNEAPLHLARAQEPPQLAPAQPPEEVT